jgi:hypothetical protein
MRRPAASGESTGSARLCSGKQLPDGAGEFRLGARPLGRSLRRKPRPEAKARRLRRMATRAMFRLPIPPRPCCIYEDYHGAEGRATHQEIPGAVPTEEVTSSLRH